MAPDDLQREHSIVWKLLEYFIYLFKLIGFNDTLQRFGSSTDFLRSNQAYVLRSTRIWMRGRINASDELCLAQCFRNFPSFSSSLHGCCRWYESLTRTRQSLVLCITGNLDNYFNFYVCLSICFCVFPSVFSKTSSNS